MENFRSAYRYVFLLPIIILDQVTKCYFLSILPEQPLYTISVFPFLDMVYVWNYGISFGIFREYYQYSNYVFLIINTVIILYLLYYIHIQKDIYIIYGTLCITGGAIGNLIDRIYRGAVYDFIYFYYNDIGFPAFNFADAIITIGATILVFNYFRKL